MISTTSAKSGLIDSAVQWAKSKHGQRLLKYAASSVISTITTLILIFITYDFLRLWSAGICSMFSSACNILPSYYLNRRWAWGKSGKSHLWKEIVPFWVIALIGLALATLSGQLAEHFSKQITSSRDVATLFVAGANFASYGILWSARYMLLNKLLFHEHYVEETVEEDLVLD